MSKQKHLELAMKFAELRAVGLVMREIEQIYCKMLRKLSATQRRMYYDFITAPSPLPQKIVVRVRGNAKR